MSGAGALALDRGGEGQKAGAGFGAGQQSRDDERGDWLLRTAIAALRSFRVSENVAGGDLVRHYSILVHWGEAPA